VKMAQAVAYGLGLQQGATAPNAWQQWVSVTSSDTEITPNGSQTGGSGTSEAAVGAALKACAQLQQALAPVRASLPANTPWPQVVAAAAAQGVLLTSTGWWAMPQGEAGGYPFTYFAVAAACSEVELDALTGEVQVLRTDIVYDAGDSLNCIVDIGQIEGAFVQGLGYFFTEGVVINEETGMLENSGTWDYKPPSSQDIPIEFNITLLAETPNPATNSVLGSKATGEPPYALALSAYLAARDCVTAMRTQEGVGGGVWYDLPVPATVDQLQEACGVPIAAMNLSP
jgi:xanthine dehydrogenase/oxidase